MSRESLHASSCVRDGLRLVQRLYKELAALFKVEDAESRARFAFERVNNQKKRRTAHVTDADVTAGQQAITRTHANVLERKSRVEDVVEMLTAFQAAAFPEISFHMSVCQVPGARLIW